MPGLPPRVVRIAREQHARTVVDALSGLGGLADDGRWHTKGRRIIYTSTSASLCLLERLVHGDEWLTEAVHDRVLLHFNVVPVSHIQLAANALDNRDESWRLEGNAFCRRVGDLWLRDGKSCALVVPSAVVPEETNVLFNPAHPDFAEILAANPVLESCPLRIDGRVANIVDTAKRASGA